MAIVEYEYYTQTFFGEAIAETDFSRYEARAQDAILLACKGRVTEDNFSELSSSLQEAVKKAICAQCEYFSLYGLDVANIGVNSGGFTVGKVRLDNGGSGASIKSGVFLSPLAISYLEQTGLLNPSVPFIDIDILRC